MPLIRYNVGDLVNEPCYDPYVKRRVVKDIDGRAEDYIYLPDGRQIGKLDHVFKDTINFAEVQIYQKKNFDIIVYVVKSGAGWKNDELLARRLLKQSIGNTINIKFEYVDALVKTKAGKTRFVISDLN